MSITALERACLCGKWHGEEISHRPAEELNEQWSIRPLVKDRGCPVSFGSQACIFPRLCCGCNDSSLSNGICVRLHIHHSPSHASTLVLLTTLIPPPKPLNRSANHLGDTRTRSLVLSGSSPDTHLSLFSNPSPSPHPFRTFSLSTHLIQRRIRISVPPDPSPLSQRLLECLA